MSESYKSFEDIIKGSGPLFQNLEHDYWAHIKGRRPVETLYEHSSLVADYLIKIIEAHGIETIIDKIICSLSEANFAASKARCREYLKEAFANSIFLHDLGKVNCNFQVNRMKNPLFKPKHLKIEHQHSFPGAYIFCNYYFKNILDDDLIENDDKYKLFFLIIALANPIIRHHSSYIDFFRKFENKKRELSECFEFLGLYNISIDQGISDHIFVNFNLLEEQFRDNLTHSQPPEKAYLEIYLLLKFSYSLLTACDFYATNEFISGFTVSDFGLIDDELRQKIQANFWSLKKYNAYLQEEFDYYTSKPFTELQERSNANLNILRQKLTGEVISTIRKKPDNHWYYIEAPTGAGKTNLSLSCISQLLEHDKTLNKIFYVFPFTTLITQTFEGIKETIGLTNNELIQLHSRTGLHKKSESEDGEAKYGGEKVYYLDHLFVNYPFVVTSHVKFFEIVKGNDKETNYLFHRLCNSIVVIDELQSYNPKHWDKMIYFIEHYAEMLNMRFIIMSATLPKIDEMSRTVKGRFISLTPNKDLYFRNPNFKGRVTFDFTLIERLKEFKNNKVQYLSELADRIKENAEDYASNNDGKIRVLVEFITKNTASQFFTEILKKKDFSDYKIVLISGDILEHRRQEIIREIKCGTDGKVVLISTQVVEAGVDIDMDLGFKNRSILDSDEQLAGRVNRNASKNGCKVFLFELDSIKTIYGKDERYKQQTLNEYFEKNWKEILVEKRFHELYKKVFEERLRSDWTDADRFQAYQSNFTCLDLQSIQRDFTLIEDDQSESVFIPLDVSVPEKFDSPELLNKWDLLTPQGRISGEKVFQRLVEILTRDKKEHDFLEYKIDLKKVAGLVSLFVVNLYPKVINALSIRFDPEKEKYGFKYLSHHCGVYSYENGFVIDNVKEDIFL